MPTANALVAVILGFLCACGGSSSETPWPVEPSDLSDGPAGEAKPQNNVLDVRKLPDRYSEKKGSKSEDKTPASTPSKESDADARSKSTTPSAP